MRRCAAITKIFHQEPDRPFELKPIPISIGLVLVALSVWAFFYFRYDLKHMEIAVQSFGIYGVIFAVLLIAGACVLPVPSEFLIVVNMELYGVGWGLFYSWIGGIIGAVIAMYLTRWLGQPLVRRFLSLERQLQVDQWVKNRGTMGLLALRFVPFVPYHALNYVAGLLNVSLWPFVWTTAVGIIPFELWMGGGFLAISNGVWPTIIVGSLLLSILGFFSYFFRKKWLAAFTSGSPPEKQHISAGIGVDKR